MKTKILDQNDEILNYYIRLLNPDHSVYGEVDRLLEKCEGNTIQQLKGTN